MAGFQDQWRQLSEELTEHAEELSDAQWPSRYMITIPTSFPCRPMYDDSPQFSKEFRI